MVLVKGSRLLVVIALMLGVLALPLVGCGADEPETIAPEAPDPAEPAEPDVNDGAEVPPADTDRVLVESKCSGCHALDRVWAASKDLGQWDSTIRRMEANGLQITDEERDTIAAYLAAQ